MNDMGILKLQFVGIASLLMHNIRLANPLDKYAKALKILTGKRSKTDQDQMEISRLEWEGALYLEEGKVAIPAKNITASLLAGAKKTKNGVKFASGVLIEEDYAPLAYDGPKIIISENGEIPNPVLDKFYPHYCHQAMVKIGKQTILRTRPIFPNWQFTATLLYDTSVIDERTLLKIAEDAGKLVGLGDMRPRMGRYVVEKFKQ